MASLWSRVLGLLGAAPSAPSAPQPPAPQPPKPAPTPRPPRLQGRYDAAQYSVENARHWGEADGASPTASNQPGIRHTLRMRSRYESDNNGYCDGMISGRADDLVGTGPVLQVLTEDDAIANQIETAFAAWAKAIQLGEKLHTMDMARCRDGEAFAVLRTNPANSNPVLLDVHPIEADRVAPPTGVLYPILPLADQTDETGQYFDGIAYDHYGNPVSYTVLRQHPGDLLRVYPPPHDVIPARYMLHWFRRKRPGQLRGVPELTSSLPLFAYLRRWTLANLSAAEVAATMGAAVLESDVPPDADTVEPSPFSTVDIERGMMTELPGGYKLSQMQAAFPTATYSEFKKSILAESARPLKMPLNVAMADSSGHNFSSAKLDHYGYRGGIKVDRAFSENHTVERIFLEWVAEAKLIPGLLPAGIDVTALPRQWVWQGWPSMDKDEAKNTTEQLHNGTTTLADECASEGADWRARIKQMGKEKELRDAAGVPLPPPGGAGMAPGAGGGAAPPAAPAGNPFAGERNGHDLTGLGGAGRLDFRRRAGNARRQRG